MKKLLLCFSAVFCFLSFSYGSDSYKINTAEVDALFANAEEISLVASPELELPSSVLEKGGGKTMSGYLLRSFFCGVVGLHRTYMGTNGRSVWWWYLCVPVAGGVTGCVDFWGVVFGGQKQLDKYANNDELVVWW